MLARARCGQLPTQGWALNMLVNLVLMLQMGHATAEAVVHAGLQLVPFSFTGSSEAVAVGNVGVEGIPVELVAPEERQEAMQQVKEKYKDLVIIDFTLPQAVNGTAHSVRLHYCSSSDTDPHK